MRNTEKDLKIQMLFISLLNFLMGLDTCVTWLEIQMKILRCNFVAVENSSVAMIWNGCTVIIGSKFYWYFSHWSCKQVIGLIHLKQFISHKLN